MPVITLSNENKTIEAPVGANLRRTLLTNGVSPYIGFAKVINCRGFELCGTCRVEIADGKGASPRREDEEQTLISSTPFYARRIEKNIRLSCQVSVTGDMTVKTYPKVALDMERTREMLIKSGISAAFLVLFGVFFLAMFLDMIKII
ncbi:MAG TPA: 2Fe-2S iron-sulfur cluster-binding protein [Bacteroidota bacterium]|nr:2Fe-2S iron-sulfur cluster-binding protein [Bacteroidota bacterium]